MSKPSNRTKIKGFRVTITQATLLESPFLYNKGSALVRALLTLYFNKKLPASLNIEGMIEEEHRKAGEAERRSNELFTERVQALKNGTNN